MLRAASLGLGVAQKDLLAGRGLRRDRSLESSHAHDVRLGRALTPQARYRSRPLFGPCRCPQWFTRPSCEH